jgi:hypothetical protein
LGISDSFFFRTAGEIGKRVDFTWGGDWKREDKPHFQWDEHGKYNGDHIKAGKYPSQMPLYKREEDMTKEQTQDMINEAMEAQKPAVWDKLEEVPEWGRSRVEKLMERKILNGTGTGLGLNFDQLRILVLNDGARLYDGKCGV